MICQRSTLPRLAQLPAPERRRIDIEHPARDGGGALAMRRLERRLGHRPIADRGAVHIGLVGEVHQIVDHQPVVAFGMDGTCRPPAHAASSFQCRSGINSASASAGLPGQIQMNRCRSSTG